MVIVWVRVRVRSAALKVPGCDVGRVGVRVMSAVLKVPLPLNLVAAMKSDRV
jgi:hypothetical protein